jgi:hypothetical protein
MRRPEVSLVIPLFNEAGSLPILAAEIREALESTGKDYESIYVDDGSMDGSLDVLRELARDDERIRVLRLRRNSGQSAALAAGFHHARGTVVVTLDADLQNDPADIPRLLEALPAVDVVCGVRTHRQDAWLRRASSRIANRIRNRVTRESVADVGCTLRAYRADFLYRAPAFHGMHRFLPTLLRLAGARVTEMPVNHRPRLYGKPKYNIRNRILRALVDLLGVRWLQSRWIDLPLGLVLDQEPLDAPRLAGRFVDVDDDGGQADVALGDFEGDAGLKEETLEDPVGAHADDRIVGAGHADVGQQGGAAGQDALVAGGDVGVGADDGAHPAVEVEGDCLLFAGRLGVEVDEDDLHLGIELFEQAVSHQEG